MRPRLHAVTTLRFFAALHVVLFHMRVVGIMPGGPWWYQNLASIGYVGVNFFFVLSGFILVYTYEGTEVDARAFWRARFARIYPAYLVSLVVAAPFFFFAVRHLDLPIFAWSQHHLVLACALTLGLLQAWVPQGALTWNSVCWSLSVEAFFYLLFPFLLLRSRRFSKTTLARCIPGLWAVSLTLALGYVLLHPDGIEQVNSSEATFFWKNVLSFNPLVRLPEFVIGMCTGRLFLARAGRTDPFSPAIPAGLAAFALVVFLADRIPGPIVSTGLLSPAFAAIIYGVAEQPRWTSWLAHPWLVVLGDASYSLYLLHSIVVTKTFASLPGFSWPVRVSACFAVAIGASLACFYLVEEPARELLRGRRKKEALVAAVW